MAHIAERYGAHMLARGDAAERHRRELLIATETSLDRIVGGALAAGEPIAFVGPSSVGKLSLALRTVASAQRQGGMVAWIDTTASFDPLAAEHAGVDLEHAIVIRTREIALATAAALRSEGFRLVVADVGEPALGGVSVDDLAPALPTVRGSPAALLIVAAELGSRVAVPTYRFERIAWERRFGRTVGWSFATGRAHASGRALFCVTTDGSFVDLGTRADLARVAV